MHRATRALALVVALLAGQAKALPVETELGGELAFWFGDDDMLHASQETLPESPGPAIGERRRSSLVLDGLSPQRSQAERRLTLVLRVERPETVDEWGSAALLRLAIEPTTPESTPLELRDAGSRLSLSHGRAQRIEIELYPLSGDQLRIGSLEPLTWAGESGPERESPYPRDSLVPAVRLGYRVGAFDAQAFAKTALLRVSTPEGPPHQAVNYALLGGAGLRLSEQFRFELSGGYLQHGAHDQPDVRGVPLHTAGATARFVLAQGHGQPAVPGLFPSPDRAAGQQGFGVSLEAVLLSQNLKDPDRPGTLHETLAPAAGLLAQFGTTRLRLCGGIVLRSVLFVTRNGPSVTEPESIPIRMGQSEERLAFVSSRFQLGQKFELGADFGLTRPAAVFASSAAGGRRTWLVHGPARLTALPDGSAVLPILELRPSLGIQAAKLVSVSLWLQYKRDPNAVGYARAPSGPELRAARIAPDFLGYGIGARAGF